MAKIRQTPTPVPIPTVQQDQLAIPHAPQEWDNWCWAACTQMVVQFFHGGGVSQADIANRAFGRTDCGVNAGGGLCNNGLSLLNPIPSVQSVLIQWKVQADHVAGPVTFADVQKEIGQQSPIEAVYNWTSGGGHAVVITGWIISGGDNKLRINDPAISGTGLVSYGSALLAYGLGAWADSFRLRKAI